MTTALPEPLGVPGDLTVRAQRGQVELHLALPYIHTTTVLLPHEAVALATWLDFFAETLVWDTTGLPPHAAEWVTALYCQFWQEPRQPPSVPLPTAVGITTDQRTEGDYIILWFAAHPFTQPFVIPATAAAELTTKLVSCAVAAHQEATR